MVIDCSAITAILFDEGEAGRFAKAIARSNRPLIAMPTLLEITLVVGRYKGLPGQELLRSLLSGLDLTAVPFGADHLAAAEAAWWRFGKGRHPAALNFGDCFSYALGEGGKSAAALQRRRFRPDRYSRGSLLTRFRTRRPASNWRRWAGLSTFRP
jgi:ribonuclease VapC